MHVAAPVLGEHHHVLDPVDGAAELALLVGPLGVGVVRLGLGPGVARLGHVVLPGLAGVEALLIEGNSELSHVDPLFGVRLWGLAATAVYYLAATVYCLAATVYCRSLSLLSLWSPRLRLRLPVPLPPSMGARSMTSA